MLGTSDPWSTSHSSQRTSVLYCRLSDFWTLRVSGESNNSAPVWRECKAFSSQIPLEKKLRLRPEKRQYYSSEFPCNIMLFCVMRIGKITYLTALQSHYKYIIKTGFPCAHFLIGKSCFHLLQGILLLIRPSEPAYYIVDCRIFAFTNHGTSYIWNSRGLMFAF